MAVHLAALPPAGAATLTQARQRQLEGLQSLSAPALQDVDRAVSAPVLRERMQAILSDGTLSVSGRPAGDDARGAAHRAILATVEALKPRGVELLGELKLDTAVPVARDAAGPGQVEIDGKTWPLLPLWPNGAMPSLCPTNGIEGRLVYVGAGRWNELSGLDLPGSIALMDFSGGRNWERLYSLGCQAVIVAADTHVNRENAEALFCHTPLPCPRFYADSTTSAELVARAERRPGAGGGEPAGARGVRCRVSGGHVYQRRALASLFVWLPPTDPLRYTVRRGELLQRIAADAGTSAAELTEINKLASDELSEGQTLELPGSARRYTVKPDDLFTRLCAEFGVRAADVLKESAITNAAIAAGTVLTIPNLPGALVLATRMDSVCAVPDAPHGAKAAANVATALGVLERLAEPSRSVRRRGVVMAFLDGDTLGGLASRAVAEYVLQARGELAPPATRPQGAALPSHERYRQVLEWLDGRRKAVDPEVAQWLAAEWLAAVIDRRRVAFAERRVAAIRTTLDAQAGAAARARAQADVNECDAGIAFIVGARQASLGRSGMPPMEQAASLFAYLADEGRRAQAEALGLTPAALRGRLEEEFAEESRVAEWRRNNAEVVARVMQRIHAVDRPGDWGQEPVLGVLLDLSDGSTSIGFASAADARGLRPAAAASIEGIGERWYEMALFASAQAGWERPWAFVPDRTRADFVSLPVNRPPYYTEFWAAAGVSLLPLATLNDFQPVLDTPLDVLERFSVTNLSAQASTAVALVAAALESPAEAAPKAAIKAPPCGRVGGRTLRFNMRSGIDAREAVPRACVFLPNAPKSGLTPNAGARVGARLGSLSVSMLNGRYEAPLETTSFQAKNHILAYHLDPSAAVFDQALDNGQIGTQAQTPVFKLLPGQETEKNLILTPIYPFLVFPGVDPVDYLPCSGALLTDSVLRGTPAHWSRDEPGETYTESDISASVFYLERGRRVAISVPKRMLLLGPLQGDSLSRGDGYRVGPDGAGRNLTLPLTPLRVARDWAALAERRLGVYRLFGIRDVSVEEAVTTARHKLDDATRAADTREWQACIGAAREAWGILARNHPRILQLGREAVFSVVILMGLLIPACVFVERLVLRARGVLGHLAGVVGLFIAATLFLKAFHPAFRIAVSPFIVVIAFTMILMSSIVLSICYQRFDVLVRRARIRGGEAESEEISLGGTLATALSLGISNLRKRPSRTALTAFTVAVLTFSIVLFVAVQARNELYARPLALEGDIEGQPVPASEIERPAYEGVLFRGFVWSPLAESFVSAIGTEFGSRFDVVCRAWYIDREGGNAADAEGVNQIELVFGKRRAVVNGIMCMEPGERRFSGLHRAVSGSAWFREAAGNPDAQPDRFTVILPDRTAEELGITPEMLLDANGARRPQAELPTVRMANGLWKVVGILDTSRADRMRDVNGKSLAMVDYLRSAITPSIGTGFVENESDTHHVSWRRLALVPMAARNDVLAKYRSVAVRFAPGDDRARFRGEVAARLNVAMFGHMDGKVSLLTARRAKSISGLAKVLVPILLCILIVANTMTGTVDERKGEVQMLGAVGLSPRQISMLLLSESAVFSVLGIVFGVFGGLLFSRVAAGLPQWFGALSFNFTSLASTGLALGTGLVVLLATLLPARKAAALAAPSGMGKWTLPEPDATGRLEFSLPFTLTRGNAVGMAAFFRRHMLNHTEASSLDFNCRDVTLGLDGGGGPPAIRISARMWLAPYDLDVAQRMDLRIVPTGSAGVFGVAMHMQRTSGSEDAWRRTNFRFLDGVRQQFLIWRNLSPAARKACIDEGAGLVKNAGGAAA